MVKNVKGIFGLFLLMGIFSILIGLIFAAISFLANLSESNDINVRTIFLSNILRFFSWGILSPIIFQFTNHFVFIKRNTLLRNLLIHIPVGLLFSFFHSLIYASLSWMLIPSYGLRYSSFFPYFREYVFFGDIYMGVLLYPLIVISVNAFLFYRNYQKEEAKTALLEAQLAQSQLQALKMQIHPHFLFNTLHSISSLVLDDPPKANAMIARLGDFLRLTLEHSEEQIVPLNEELDFLRSYLEIEQIRFQDRLTVEYKIETEALTAEVPHLILQPIVENAIKHGIAPYSSAGRISIRAQVSGRKLEMRIKDDGHGKEMNEKAAEHSGNGKGLFNVRSRLNQVYGDDFQMLIKDNLTTGFEVDLNIPVRSNRKNNGRKQL